MKTLNEAKFYLLSRGVHPEIVDSVTQAEVDICLNHPRVKAHCFKCDNDFTIPDVWAKNHTRTEDGTIIAKCGECYL